MSKKGLFIVIEGGDGAGTTTISNKLVESFGWSAIYTHEPGGSKYAEKIRELILSDEAKLSDPETQFLLFWAARQDHISNTIKPALEKGKIVICDRFDSSTYAYQVVAQKRPNLEKLFWQIRKFVLNDIEPDLYILLDVPAKIGIQRVRQRNEELNYFDKMKLEFHEQVNKALRDFVGEKIVNGHIIDATQELDKVFQDAFVVINKYISSENI